ncbi:unnamed protein product [Prorocentrum cordatum]|uniref:Pre-mRNA-processing factor 19 n=1 Tax=Prorocentrum cordatum TaxID=2364126 RepID=A0ABN9RDK9_9DINO|nr:unnamed protein product [Polarella glacialis]
MEETPSAPQAKQQLRQLGKSELASKLGKLSKIRHTIRHPTVGLVIHIAQAFVEEKEVGDKLKSKGKKIVDAQVEAGVSPSGVVAKCDVAAPLEYNAEQIEAAVVEPPPNLMDVLLEKSREVVVLKRHLELAQAAYLEGAGAVVAAGLDVQVCCAAVGRSMELIDTFTGRKLASMDGHAGPVMCVAELDGDIVSGSIDKTIRRWNSRTGEAVTTLEGHAGPVWCLLRACDSLFSCSDDRRHDPPVGQRHRRARAHPRGALGPRQVLIGRRHGDLQRLR